MKVEFKLATNRMIFEIKDGNGSTINGTLEQPHKKVSLKVWRSPETVSKGDLPKQGDMILSADLGDDFEIATPIAENIIEQLLDIWG